jgi:hypothetical protein
MEVDTIITYSGCQKKRSGIQTFFSTTVHPLMPHFRISEHYYGKRYIMALSLGPSMEIFGVDEFKYLK